MTSKGRKRKLSALNPFSSPAIAIVSAEADPYTLNTEAMASACECMDAYLGRDHATMVEPMNVIAITGESGTGKTHIADALLRHARDAHLGRSVFTSTRHRPPFFPCTEIASSPSSSKMTSGTE